MKMKWTKLFFSMTFAALIFTGCGAGTGGTDTSSSKTDTSQKEVSDQTEKKDIKEEEAPVSGEWTPEGHQITIMNYVKEGGEMDIATKHFVKIAGKYTDAIFNIENMPGDGGMTAMDYVLDQPANGYLIYAGTVSNIAYLVSNQENLDKYVWGFEWIDDIMADPFSIMVKKDSEIDTLEDLIATDNEIQTWCGPATGGAKHLAGLQIWDAVGLKNPVWKPFESGPDALEAVINDEGVASIGNPGDVDGRELKSLVISSETPLANYPDVPNFESYGYPELDKLNMWRGFAVKDGTPENMITWFQNLVDQVTADPDWIAFSEASSVVLFNKTTEEFEEIIQDNIKEYIKLLKKLEMISQDYTGKKA